MALFDWMTSMPGQSVMNMLLSVPYWLTGKQVQVQNLGRRAYSQTQYAQGAQNWWENWSSAMQSMMAPYEQALGYSPFATEMPEYISSLPTDPWMTPEGQQIAGAADWLTRKKKYIPGVIRHPLEATIEQVTGDWGARPGTPEEVWQPPAAGEEQTPTTTKTGGVVKPKYAPGEGAAIPPAQQAALTQQAEDASLIEQYGQMYGRVMGELEDVGKAAEDEIKTSWQNWRNTQMTSLINRGLYDSTLSSDIDRAATREEERALTRLREDVATMRANWDYLLTKEKLTTEERIAMQGALANERMITQGLTNAMTIEMQALLAMSGWQDVAPDPTGMLTAFNQMIESKRMADAMEQAAGGSPISGLTGAGGTLAGMGIGALTGGGLPGAIVGGMVGGAGGMFGGGIYDYATGAGGSVVPYYGAQQMLYAPVTFPDLFRSQGSGGWSAPSTAWEMQYEEPWPY